MQIKFLTREIDIGTLLVASTAKGVCFVGISDDKSQAIRNLYDTYKTSHNFSEDFSLTEVIQKVARLFAEPEFKHNLQLDIPGTDFQRKVLNALQKIPAGTVKSYSSLATELGNPNATRAVARACATNNIAVIIPCHRVIGKNGSLTGYRWGIERKRFLLEKEKTLSRHYKTESSPAF